MPIQFFNSNYYALLTRNIFLNTKTELCDQTKYFTKKGRSGFNRTAFIKDLNYKRLSAQLTDADQIDTHLPVSDKVSGAKGPRILLCTTTYISYFRKTFIVLRKCRLLIQRERSTHWKFIFLELVE